MFRFENEHYLYLLALLPVFFILFALSKRWREKAVERFGDRGIVSRLMPDYSERRHQLKFGLYLLAFVFLIIGLANPQIGTKLERVKRQGIDLIIALDVSKSMLAEDLQPNRLERSKQLISKLIEDLKDDRIGIIVFAGNAYLQMPLTIDYAAAKLFLKTINTDIVPTQGTAIGEAIELALASYNEEDKKHKALIVISDGENHESGALDMAERAADDGVIIHTLGIGSLDGASIPVFQNGRRLGYKQNKKGEVIVSRLNPEMMKDVAKKGNGSYVHIRGAQNEVSDVLGLLSSIEKRDFEDRTFTDYADQFQYFIALALLFLLIEFFLSERTSGAWYRWMSTMFGAKAE